MSEMEIRIRGILSSILGVDANSIPADARLNHFAGWDSLNHMNLMLALEDDLDIEFTDEQISSLDSLRLLIDFVRDHIE
jgi:acyl carrier protein